jgi:ribonucleotide reductase alpha subunit
MVDIEKLSKEELINYFNGDELAANVWLNKYAHESEVTPDDMHKRMAIEFARIEENYQKQEIKIDNLSKYAYNRQNLTEESIFQLFKNFKYIIPQGSIMSVLGTGIIGSLSNCYVIPSPYDSYGGLLKTDQELAQLMKRRAGVGGSLDSLRPGGCKVNNVAKTTTGADSYMERFSNTTREVAQEGRRGALMLLMSCKHPSIFKFVTKKKDRTKVTGANVSATFTNEFMQAVKDNLDFICGFPTELNQQDLEIAINLNGGINNLSYNELKTLEVVKTINGNPIHVMKIKAKELWDLVVEMAWENAEPGIAFIDRVHNYSPESVYDFFKAIACNPCVKGNTEILTKEGYYQIQDLVNKEIEIWNGYEWSKVTPIITGYNQHMLKITLSDGRTLICTDYHKWILKDGVRKEAIELKIGDKIQKYNFPILKEGIDINEKIAYTQGFISAEGQDGYNHLWLYDTKYMCSDRLDGHIGNEYSTSTGTFKKVFYLGSQYEEKSFIPFNWNLKSKIEWLSGLFDGDGTELIEGGLQLWSVDYNFLLGVQKLLTTVGINSKILNGTEETYKLLPDGKGSQKEYFCQKSYRICIGAQEIQNLKSIGLNCNRLLFNKNPNRSAQRFVKITKIEDCGYEDIVYCFNEPINNSGIFNGILTANCGEQWLNAYDSCRLFALNLFSIVKNPFTKESKVDYDLLYSIAYEQQRLADDLIDLELERIKAILEKVESDPEPDDIKQIERNMWEKIYHVCKAGRRTGCGITALGDMLAALGLKYDSNEGMEVIDKVMNTKMEAELDCTIDLAILRGSFEGWNPDLEFHVAGDDMNGYVMISGENEFYDMLYNNFTEQAKRMYNYGRRNVSWSTIAPTGTVSLMTQTTSGCEPLFMPYYMRRTKINPNENKRVDFVDQNGDSWTEYAVLHPKFRDWLIVYLAYSYKLISNLTKVELEKAFKESPWYGSTANDIDWIKRVEIQAILQKYTTNAISSTINLPNTVTKKEVNDIYISAYEKGLKGITVYRDGCRSGVLVSDTKYTSEFIYNSAFKRPTEIKGELHKITLNGEKFSIVVGLIDDKPYEIFGCDYHTEDGKSRIGIIKKINKGNYIFDDIQLTTNMNDEQAVITRLVSTSLRHGTDIKFIVEQLNKGGGNILSFTKVLARVLKKYIPDGVISKQVCIECGSDSMVYEEGCKKCTNCGNSAC